MPLACGCDDYAGSQSTTETTPNRQRRGSR